MTSRAVGTMPPENRERLLRIAAREFVRIGYERASLNTIIRSCRMSKSSFYHYFDSKATLFDTVVREAAEALGRDLAIPPSEELRGAGFWDHVAGLCERLLSLATRESWYADFGRLFYLPDAPASHSPAFREVTAGIADWIEQALAVGRAYGAVRDDLPPALQTQLTMTVLRTLDQWALEHTDTLAEQPSLADAQLDVLHRLLRP